MVEFVRVNPKLYFHHTMSNAQVAAAASAMLGLIVIAIAQARGAQSTAQLKPETITTD